MQSEAIKTELLKDWTHQELRRELFIWSGVDLGITQFYAWLPNALIQPKRIYTNRDRKKLLKFAEFMARYKRLQEAKAKLIEHMQLHPEEYTNEQQPTKSAVYRGRAEVNV